MPDEEQASVLRRSQINLEGYSCPFGSDEGNGRLGPCFMCKKTPEVGTEITSMRKGNCMMLTIYGARHHKGCEAFRGVVSGCLCSIHHSRWCDHLPQPQRCRRWVLPSSNWLLQCTRIQGMAELELEPYQLGLLHPAPQGQVQSAPP